MDVDSENENKFMHLKIDVLSLRTALAENLLIVKSLDTTIWKVNYNYS